MPCRTRSTCKKSNDKDAAAPSSSKKKKKIGNTVQAKQRLATDSQKTGKCNEKDAAAASSSKKKIGNTVEAKQGLATDSQKQVSGMTRIRLQHLPRRKRKRLGIPAPLLTRKKQISAL